MAIIFFLPFFCFWRRRKGARRSRGCIIITQSRRLHRGEGCCGGSRGGSRFRGGSSGHHYHRCYLFCDFCGYYHYHH